ncbi:oxygen-insensitive NAD(P)H nitroreductase [Azonexus sp.]|uniref:oxygen-insensitive NAD(P)H nitroreductase n=1 Tax=Azonexus sp. TaxID=1872668 RepID=UPI0027B8CA8F|nr:oxygen-insensitive NAD(P)H nitroreductase [Azonexus sp.]
MNIAEIASTRHTCKAFDASRRIDAALIDQLRTLLRFAPSSVNSQPWHFIIASSESGKASIADTLKANFAYNEPKVRNASHVVVLCARRELDDAHLASILAQEEKDGRFATPEARTGQQNTRNFYASLHRDQLQDAPVWMDKQVYLALGSLMFGAASLGLDACPMEGIDCAALDQALGLEEKGLRSVVLLALGYRSAQDFNASLPKSRLSADVVISEI